MERTELRNRQQTAAVLLSRGQIGVLVGVLLGAALCVHIGTVHALLEVLVALGTLFYVEFVTFKLVLWGAALRYKFPALELPHVDDPSLPRYSVLVPMKSEAASAQRLVKAMSRIRYPVDKLEILLLVEESDPATQAALGSVALPTHFTVLQVPPAGPGTKPKALNYGWSWVTGDQVVIFDAEDSPDPDQLLKAVAGFRCTRDLRPRVVCLQARLVFWNARPHRVSSLYFAEYLVHFNWVLKGLASLQLIPPLGGTSNHFAVDALRAVAATKGTRSYTTGDGRFIALEGPWDEWNVTEDATLAGDLAFAGYRVDMLDSVTYEEAPVDLERARKQRSRWLQGFLHTGLVHSRQPLRRMAGMGVIPWFCFELTMFGAPLSYLLFPLAWGTTTLYIVSRFLAWVPVSDYIHSLFPPVIFYAGLTAAGVGNLLLFLQLLLVILNQQEDSEASTVDGGALCKHMQEQQYGLIPRLFLTPLWWLFTSLSAYRAVRKLLTPGLRSAWDLSAHGHHANLEAELELQASVVTTAVPRQG